MSALQNEELMKAHARVMLGYVSAFFFAVGFQFKAKVNAQMEYKKAKKQAEAQGQDTKNMRFNRYSEENSALLAADRGVGNFVEWAPAFLALFATHAAVAGDCTKLGWAYVALRFLYPVLAQAGGIKQAGARPLIFMATLPMYGILTALSVGIAKKVF